MLACWWVGYCTRVPRESMSKQQRISVAHAQAVGYDWRSEGRKGKWAGSHLKAQVGSCLRSRLSVHG